MSNIINNSIEALTQIEQEVKDKKWTKVISELIGLVVSLVLSAFIGQTLWNNSVPNLFPMVSKARLYDVLYLHILLKTILN